MMSRMNKLLAGLLALVMFCTMPGIGFVMTNDALAEAAAEATPELTEEPEVTAEPAAAPTEEPTAEPTAVPTEEPTAEPAAAPTEEPTAEPAAAPTEEPTVEPAAAPTEEPTVEPTAVPTAEPAAAPTEEPTAEPVAAPTEEPTAEPTAVPTEEPTAEPAAAPTEEPTAEPAAAPTEEPTAKFVSGYGWVNKGDKIYSSASLSKALGTVTGKSVVYYADCDEVQDSYKVAFVMDGQVRTGWIHGQDAVQMSAGESAAYAKKASGTYSYNGHPLEDTAFEPAEKPTAEPTAEPTPDPETVLKGKEAAMTTSRPRSGGKTDKGSKPAPEARPMTLAAAPAQVTGLQGKPVDTNATYMKWDAVTGADGYQVLRAGSAEGTYSFLKNVEESEARNYSLTPGGTYYYKVRAYVLNADGSKTFGELSDFVEISVLGTCDNFGVYAVDTNASKLVWNAVPGATGYQVFRTVAGSGEYAWVKNNPTPGVNNYSLTPGTTYYYKIRAYVDLSDGTRAYGQFSEGKKVHILGTIKNLSLSTSVTTMNLDWSDVSSATGYQVFYTIAGTGGVYSWAKNVSVSQAKHMNLESNTDYYYKVRAYVDQPNGVRAYGQFSNAVHKVTGIAAPAVYTDAAWNNQTGITVAWKAVPGNVAGYYVFRMPSSGGSWSQIATVPSGSVTSGEAGTQEYFFTDTSVAPNYSYYYTVQACGLNGKTSQKGTQKVYATAKMETPEFIKIHGISGPGGMRLKWKDVAGIDTYEVEWTMDTTAGYELLDMYTEPTSGNHEYVTVNTTALPSGYIIYFRVRGVGFRNGSTYYTPWSEVTSAVKPFVRFHGSKELRNTWTTAVKFDVVNFTEVPITVNDLGVLTPTEGGESYMVETRQDYGGYTVQPDVYEHDLIYDILSNEAVYCESDYNICMTFTCYGEEYGINFGDGYYEWFYIGE